MPMNTYPLEQKAVLDIDPKLAAAIILRDMYEDPEFTLPEKLKALLDAGEPAWRITEGREFAAWLTENDCYNVSDAHDVLESRDVDSLVHCSEFQGSSSQCEGFTGAGDKSWDDDFVCFLIPEQEPDLFKAAYETPEDLITEYREKLEPIIGPGFDYSRHIMDVSGTYFC